MSVVTFDDASDTEYSLPTSSLHSDGDGDELNRNAQRAQGLAAIGGSRRFVRPMREHTVELPSVPLSIDVGGYPTGPIRTDRHSWQIDSLAYAGPHSTQPVLSHHGYTFNVVAEIAQGSAGRVVAAERNGLLYAVKAMHKWHAHKVCGYRRSALIAEKDIMARITEARTPSLVALLMSWEDQHSVYFVMVHLHFLTPSEDSTDASIRSAAVPLDGHGGTPAPPDDRARQAAVLHRTRTSHALALWVPH